MEGRRYHFEPAEHEPQLLAILKELRTLAEDNPATEISPRTLDGILRRHPRGGTGVFSKSQLLRGYQYLAEKKGWAVDRELLNRLRMKPVRTLSGVTPVTVLTKPFPCPGKCIFCPNDVRMPKSYLADEPGAQRAAHHAFDPYLQTWFRLAAFQNIGHRVDKVELIILGGTWSFYPEAYQIWFIKRCFDAMNDYGQETEPAALRRADAPLFEAVDDTVDGSYNRIVGDFLRRHHDGAMTTREEAADWPALEEAQRRNETRAARCVGLVVETRPDHISEDEVRRIRRLGATKVQIGLQSLDDAVLAKNKRGHTVEEARRAVGLLRQAGFKIHAHWMPNLYGSSPAADVEDYARLFADPAFRPDELKIYPCSLIESAELMDNYRRGEWQPYTHDELLDVLVGCLERTPEYCRLTRIIRDIPSQDIVVGNKLTNFRQLAEAELERRGGRSRDIRAREIRGQRVTPGDLRLEAVEYDTPVGREHFLQYVTQDGSIAAFLRLSLPTHPPFLEELAQSAMIREVHVYGAVAALGKRQKDQAQHTGLGRRLVEEAARRAREAGFQDLAVISSVGTREYYRGLGFTDGRDGAPGGLYQHRGL